MRSRCSILIPVTFAAALAVAPAFSQAYPAPRSATVVKVRNAAVPRYAHMSRGGGQLTTIAQADARPAVQLRSTPVSSGPQMGLATGTAHYDLGPTGLEDDVPTIGVTTKF
jgi:hypothetical protein